MAIEFRCSQCNQLLRVPDDSGGKSARCPKCQALMTIPVGGSGPFSTPPPQSPPTEFPPPPPKETAAPSSLPPRSAADNPFGDGGTATSESPFAGPGAASLNPYASPAVGGFTYPQIQFGGPRSGLPWETKGQSVATWWETAKLCMMQPTYAYSVMRQYGGMGQPMMYCGFGLAAGVVGQMLWYLPFMAILALAANGGGGGGDAAAMLGVQVVLTVIQGVVGVVLGATLGLLIGAAVGHVCLMLVGGARHGFETTLRVLGYANGSTAWLNVIPFIGGLIGAVWLLVLEIVGLARAHEISVGKAALAVFLPLIVCLSLCAVIVTVGIGIGAFSALNN